jgi:CBS domain containing-hemolysin-like protein
MQFGIGAGAPRERGTATAEPQARRIDLLTLALKTPVVEAIDRMLESGYSRVPVYRDHIDNIAGVLYIKDLLRLYREDRSPDDLTELLRPAYYVPETKKVGELLAEMQAERNHIAIVVDEYGGVAGIATLEDIVEEIVGEIQDEYDQAEELLFQQVGEHEYIFQAKIDINDFNQVMGTNLPKESADTLGGLLYSWFGRIPRAGESMGSDDILFTIEQVTGRRIRKVRAVKPAPAEQTISS